MILINVVRLTSQHIFRVAWHMYGTESADKKTRLPQRKICAFGLKMRNIMMLTYHNKIIMMNESNQSNNNDKPWLALLVITRLGNLLLAPRWDYLGRLQQRTGHQELLLLDQRPGKKMVNLWLILVSLRLFLG